MRMYIIQLYWEFYQGSQLVSHLVWDAVPYVWDAVFAFLAGLPAQLVSLPVSHLVLLFGVYGCVILLCTDVPSPLHCLHETQ